MFAHDPPVPRAKPVEAPQLPLVGRDEVLTRIAASLESDRPLLVLGEAGIGKTSVARAAIHAAARDGFEGGGYATVAWMPMLALEIAFGRSFGGRDVDAVANDIEGLVGDGVLLVDDAQWIDATTLSVLGRLAGRIGLVVGVRIGDPGAPGAIAALEGFDRVELDGLHPSAATVVARRARPDIDGAGLRRALSRAGGNPLLLQELAAAGEDDSTLALVIRRRLDGLPPRARDAMLLLALARRPLALTALGAGARHLVDVSLARIESGDRLAVRHDLLAEAVVASASDEEVQAAHGRLARLSEAPGDAARHLLAAGHRAEALQRALEAAAAASRPEERGAHLAIAAEAAQGDESVDLRFEAADALLDGRAPSAARDVLAPVAEAPLTARRAHVLARSHRLTEHAAAARDAIERGRARVQAGRETMDRPGTTADEVALELEAARVAEWNLDSGREAVRLATAAEALARRAGVLTTEARAVLGSARCLAGDMRGLDDLIATVREAEASGDAELCIATAITLVFEFLKSGRAVEGYELAARMRARAASLGRVGDERRLATWEAGLGWHAGRFPEALAAAEALDATARPDDADWFLAQLLIDTGRFAEARVRVDRMVATALPGEWSLGDALWILTELEFWSGRFEAAAAAADRHASEVPNAGHRLFIEVAGAWARFEMGMPPNWPAMHALRPMTEGAEIELEALRALANDEAREAADLFRASVERWAGRHARGELRASWALGESLRRAGESTAARDHLLALEERLVALGAQPLLARTHRSLRLLGERRTAATEPSTADRLSRREREILELVASGLRDREIAARLGLSRWSVLRAVESASAKLGAQTRAEAVASLVG